MPRFTDADIRRALISPTRPRRVTFPGRPEIPLGVRLLDDLELDDCRIEAQRKIRQRASTRSWNVVEMSALDPTLMERMVEREIVLRAFLDADTIESEKPIPFFAGDGDLAALGSAGVTDLMELYNEHQEWMNPHLKMSEEDERAFLEELGKGPSAELSLTAIEPSMLRRCVISMAKRLADSRTTKSSTSSESEPRSIDG